MTNGKFCPDDNTETVAESVQLLDPGEVIHHPEGVAIGVELTTCKARPGVDARLRQPLLEACVAPLTFRIVDRSVTAEARVEPPQQIPDDRSLVLLHEVPEVHVDRHPACLDLCDRLRAVVRPMKDAWDICGIEPVAILGAPATQLLAQQRCGGSHVFFTICE